MAIHVEVNFSGLPFVAGLGEEGTDQAQERGFVGEDPDNAGAALKFHVHSFQGVGGAQSALVRHREGKASEALGQVFFHPSRELGCRLGVGGDDFFEPGLGAEAVGTVEDRANGLGDGGALIQAWDVRLSILLEVELAALPQDAGEDGLPGGGQALVLVTNDELGRMQAALLQVGQEGAPMDFGLAERNADAEEGAFAIGPDTQGDEHGTIADLPAVADLFVTGIEENIGAGGEGALAPAVQFRIELGRTLADLGGTDLHAAELLDDGGHFAGGDPLDIHFGQGEFEGLFAADALFEGAGIEFETAADLRDGEGDGRQAEIEGFGFKAIGVASAVTGAFIGLGVEGLGTFLDHGFIDQEPDAFNEAVGAVIGDELQDGVQ